MWIHMLICHQLFELYKELICPPTEGGGDIFDFGADPVGVHYVLKGVTFGSKDCTKELKLECAYILGQTS